VTADPGDDAALLARAAGGDHRAFAALVDRHAGMVLAVCRRHLGDDAEDAAQEAFVKAWRAAATYSGRASVRTWLYRIAVNAARDRLRHQRRRPAADVEIADLAGSLADPVGLDEQLAERGLDPELRGALTQLAPKQREVVVLADVLGAPHTEIAERQGVAVGTVKSRLHRGHARLAELLGPRERPAPSGQEPEPPSGTSKPPR
jgi:RNA polymerase sigma-70 factor (ECF subfamily)